MALFKLQNKHRRSKVIKFSCSTKNENIANFMLLCLAIFMSVRFLLTHYLWGYQSVLEWPTVSYIPITMKLIDGGYLTHDAYLNAALESPNVIFSGLIYFLTLLGVDVLDVFYFISIFLEVLTPVVVLMLFYRILEKWYFYLKLRENALPYVYILMFFAILLVANLFYIHAVVSKTLPLFGFSKDLMSDFFQPFGWDDPLNHMFVAPSTVAFFLGTCYNLARCESRLSGMNYMSITLLFFSTALHPVVGIAHFIFGLIFDVPLLGINRIIRLRISDFGIGVILPVIIVALMFDSSGSIDTKTFIDIYVTLRHPHHYRMSEIIDGWSVLWAFVTIGLIAWAICLRNKHLIFLTILSFGYLFFSVIVQYVGVEVMPSITIAILGPSRFTQYIFLLTALNFCFLLAATVSKYFSNTSKLEGLLDWISEKVGGAPRLLITLSFVFLVTGSFLLTQEKKLSLYDSHKAGLDWIAMSTASTDTFFIQEKDNLESGNILSFMVRIFSNRSIYVDQAFPFDRSSIENWADRYNLYHGFSFDPSNSVNVCLLTHEVDYFNLPSFESVKAAPPEYRDSVWNIYKSSDIFLHFNC